MSFKFLEHSNKKKALRQQVETIKKRKMASETVVNLEDFRKLSRSADRKTILVVDDDEIMRNALKRLLESEGYEVVLAEDGLAFSKVLEDGRKLDLILLDINLPWVDGFELCKMVKEHNEFSKVPLILVSGRKSDEDVEKGFDMGCNDYVVKPFDANFMVSAVNKTLQVPA